MSKIDVRLSEDKPSYQQGSTTVDYGCIICLFPDRTYCWKTGTVSVGRFHPVGLALPVAEFPPRTLASYFLTTTTTTTTTTLHYLHVLVNHISRLISIYTSLSNRYRP